MKTDEVVQAIVTHVRADTAFMLLLGNDQTRFRAASQRATRKVPSVEFTQISAPLTESTQRVTVQFDFFAATSDSMVALKGRLFALLYGERQPRTIGGLSMLTAFLDERENPDTDEGDVFHSQDYRFEPAREVN